METHAPVTGRRGTSGSASAGTIRTGGDSLADLAAYLGSLDVPFAVLDPPELRTLLARLAARYAAAAGQP